MSKREKGWISMQKEKKKKERKEMKRYIIIYDNDKEQGCMHK